MHAHSTHMCEHVCLWGCMHVRKWMHEHVVSMRACALTTVLS